MAKYLLILLVLSTLTFAGFAQENVNPIFHGPIATISEVKINTIRSDFGPAVAGDTLFFTSYSDKVLDKKDRKLRKDAFYDLYWAKIDNNGNTITKRQPVLEFLSKYHDGPVSYCEKTGELFVTQSDNRTASRVKRLPVKDTIQLRILIAKRVNGKFTSYTNFVHNNPSYSVGHPAISQTGDTLIFSSDRYGSFGATDLYCSIRKNGVWGTPENLGPKINTPGKEEFAFITHNKNGGNYLIFASNGRFGKGRLDLFYTKFPYDSKNEIEHFDAPINTEFDDFAMMIPPDGDYGYLSSNRKGTGSDDIYKFTFKKFVNPVVIVPVAPSPVKELYVYNKRTRLPVEGSKIISCDSLSYLTDNNGKALSLTIKQDICGVVVRKYGFTDSRKSLMAKVMARGQINRDTIWLDPIIGKIILHNVYYDFNKWDILPESARELDKLVTFLNENPDFKVQLSSHTDSRGSDTYNLWLSEQRAESAMNYIISHGVNQYRITAKGYGERQLLNECANGVACSPQEHRQNRRTEIFIPEYAQDVIQTAGKYSGNRIEKEYPASTASKVRNPAKETIIKIDYSLTKKNTKKYFVILNSFITKTNADQYLLEIQGKGLHAEIVEESKPFRIGIKYNSRQEALDARAKILTIYSDCWIL